MRDGLRDILSAIRMWHLWVHMASTEIMMQYRRSAIGPFWLTCQMIILVLALALVYSALFRMDIHSFLPYVASGILAWNFISMVVTEGCRVFINSKQLILHTGIPLPVFSCREVTRIGIVFVHNLLAVILMYLYFPDLVSDKLLLLIPAMAAYALNGLWVVLLFGMLSTRYRDLPQMLASLMQVTMFVTPVFWPASAIERGRYVIHSNVFYHFIEIVRAPILGQVPTNENIAVVAAVTVVGWIAATMIYARYRSRVVFCL